MSETQTENSKTFQLPSSLIGSADLSRLIRELEKLDDFMYQSKIRQPGSGMGIPKTSKQLDDIANKNHYSLLEVEHRSKLLEGLRKLEDAAPSVHISFAVEPTIAFMQKIVEWMRAQYNPYLMVEVGLQPSIGVGCVLRTNNQIFDMSLRTHFSDFRKLLVEQIDKTNEKAKTEETTEEKPKTETKK